MNSARPLRWGLIGASNIAARWVLPQIRGGGDSVEFVYSSTGAWASEYAAVERDRGLDRRLRPGLRVAGCRRRLHLRRQRAPRPPDHRLGRRRQARAMREADGADGRRRPRDDRRRRASRRRAGNQPSSPRRRHAPHDPGARFVRFPRHTAGVASQFHHHDLRAASCLAAARPGRRRCHPGPHHPTACR